MSTQEAKKKNQETLKLLRAEVKKLEKIEESVSELQDSLRKESSRLDDRIRGLAYKYDYDNIVRIGDTAYSFNYSFLHGLRQNEYNELDLYDAVDQIIPPSKNKSNLGFNVGQRIRIKQEGPVPFRYDGSSFCFHAGVDIVERGGSHYVLGVSPPEEVKNPIVRTTIECFYKDGKALVKYDATRCNIYKYFDVVDLSNYESCSHLGWDSKKGLGKSFAEYLETSGLTEKIELEDKFGFRVGEPIYLKSHEKIILKNPTIETKKFEHALGKDLYYMESFYVTSKSIGSGGWKVFGFVGDKVLVESNNRVNYRLKKEKYFDKITVDNHGNISKIK